MGQNVRWYDCDDRCDVKDSGTKSSSAGKALDVADYAESDDPVSCAYVLNKSAGQVHPPIMYVYVVMTEAALANLGGADGILNLLQREADGDKSS